MSVFGRIMERLSPNVMDAVVLDAEFWTAMVSHLNLDTSRIEELHDTIASLEVGERKVIRAGHKEKTQTQMELSVDGKTRKFSVGTDVGFAAITRIK